MMFQQTMSRRGKSSKGKNLFQVTVLLAVAVWLLYQTKHSYDRKTGYAEADVSKLSKGGTEVRFGRKVDPGSGSGISVDPHGNNSDGATDAGEAGVDQDAFDRSPEEKAEEVRHESEESPEDIVDSGKDEVQQGQQDNVTDNGESNDATEVNTEGGEQSLQRPGGKDGENADQNETKSEDGNSSEENEHPKDGAASADGSNVTNGEKIGSDEATLDTNQGENVESAEQQSETTETGGEHSDGAVRETQELANSSVSDDQSNQNLSEDKDSQKEETSHKEETVEAQEVTATNAETTSDSTAEEAATNDQSDVASHAEIAGNGSTEAAEEGSNNLPKGVDENHDVMPDTNGAPGREEDELQTDRIIEGQAAGNYSVDGVTADTSSDGGENASPNTSEENGTVMSDNNGVPKEEEVQPHIDHVSEGEKTDNSSEEVNADKSNSEVSEKEATSSGDEGTAAVAAEKENDPKSSVEAANSSLDSKNEHAELPANTEGTVMGEAQSQGNAAAAADAENTSKTSPEEEEKIASDADRSSKEVDDAMAEPQSKNATASDSGNTTELSSGNNTGSGASGSEAFLKKSAEL